CRSRTGRRRLPRLSVRIPAVSPCASSNGPHPGLRRSGDSPPYARDAVTAAIWCLHGSPASPWLYRAMVIERGRRFRAQSGAVCAADFDRDGDVDLVLARASGGLLLLDNLRGGRFAEREAGLPKTGSFRGVAAADVNADGRPDLVWTTPTSAFVALNRGDGTFLPAREIAAGGEPLLFDFDNDGALDLFLASPKGSSLWRN